MSEHRLKGTALITGASGFIGRALKRKLLGQGLDVIALRRPKSPPSAEGRSRQAAYRDIEGLKEIVHSEKPDYVFHVAGATKGVSYEDFYEANVLPTKNMLSALDGHSLKRFTLVSSLAAYGPTPTQDPLGEDAPRQPVEHYGKSKLEAEQILEASNIPWTIIRPGGVYGPEDIDYFEVFKLATRGINLFYGNRTYTMSVVYIDDVVDAIIQSTASEQAKGRGYFISDGEPVSWDDFQTTIVSASGKSARLVNLPGFFVSAAAIGGELMTFIDKKPRVLNRQKAIMGRQKAWTCSIASASRDFGYQPKVLLPEGVDKSFAWYRDKGWLK